MNYLLSFAGFCALSTLKIASKNLQQRLTLLGFHNHFPLLTMHKFKHANKIDIKRNNIRMQLLNHSLSDTEIIKLRKIAWYNGLLSNVLHSEQNGIDIVSKDCPGPQLDFLWRWIVWAAHASRFEYINFVSHADGRWLKISVADSSSDLTVREKKPQRFTPLKPDSWFSVVKHPFNEKNCFNVAPNYENCKKDTNVNRGKLDERFKSTKAIN